MGEDVIMEWVGQLGFPIFVGVFSLIKLDKTIKENTRTMMEYNQTLSGLKDLLQTKGN